MNSPEQMVNVRSTVDDVQAAVDFYAGHPGFTLRSSAAPAFAGPGGKQIQTEDPAGNVIELFEPAASSPARS